MMAPASFSRAAGSGALFLAWPALAGTIEGQTFRQPVNVSAIAMFLLFVGATLVITWWAAARSRTRNDFYTAGGNITGFQNGLAIAGDYMSAAAFLGISSLVFASGFDGLIYGVGFIVGWPVIMFLIAERLRNLGRFTFSDVASYRLQPRPMRTLGAAGTLVTVLLYLIAQMVGAGQLIRLLFGLDYEVAVLVVGTLMIVYVSAGGMLATTWVQIVKALLLLIGVSFMAFMVLQQVDFSINELFGRAAQIHSKGAAILVPGTMVKDPISALSLGLALMFGTAGLPHVLMRFFTVKNAKEARKSVFVAVSIFGYFLLLMVVISFGAIVLVGADPQYLNADGTLRGGGNMAALHLAHAVGGELFLGFICAVAFATIIAVVSGLTLSGAAAVSHDLYASVLSKGRGSEKAEVVISKIATVGIGLVAIGLGIAFEKQNVAFMVGLAFAVAASANFPIIVLSIFWRGFTTRGALWGGWTGLMTAAVLTVAGPAVWVKVLGNSTAIFPFEAPALFSMSVAFLGCWIGSVTDRSPAGDEDRLRFDEQLIRAETGLGISAPSSH